MKRAVTSFSVIVAFCAAIFSLFSDVSFALISWSDATNAISPKCAYKFSPASEFESNIVSDYPSWISFSDSSTEFPGKTFFKCVYTSKEPVSNRGEAKSLVVIPLISHASQIDLYQNEKRLNFDNLFFNLTGQKAFNLELSTDNLLNGSFRYFSGLKSYFLVFSPITLLCTLFGIIFYYIFDI